MTRSFLFRMALQNGLLSGLRTKKPYVSHAQLREGYGLCLSLTCVPFVPASGFTALPQEHDDAGAPDHQRHPAAQTRNSWLKQKPSCLE